MKKISVLLLYIILQAGCTSVLDYDELDTLDEKTVFEGSDSQNFVLLSIYSNIPRMDYIYSSYGYLGTGRYGVMLECATDDAEYIDNISNIQRFNTGNITVSYNPENQWGYLYTGVRKCNNFLENATADKLDLYKNNMDKERDGTQYYPTLLQSLEFKRAEARFLRVYFYFELVKRYGGVPLIKDISLDIDAGSYNIQRNSFEECMNYIVSELNEVIPVLPDVHDQRDGLQGQTGRATQGTAMALKSRALLYAASPLFNSSNDLTYWKDAAKASYEVVALNRYALEGRYDELFLKTDSKELIYERRVGDSNDFERANYPIGYDGGNTGTCPSQNLVDSYEMQATGLSILDPSSGYDAANPYEGRDPRFYTSILYNNCDWAGRKVEIWNGGLDAPPIQNATKTGYYLKKYMNSSVRIGAGQNVVQRHTFYIFRLGEIYLNLAEAMNEAYGPEADPDGIGMTALEAVNLIRNRAGMPDFDSGMTKETFRDKLRNERRVELSFENHRFWDVRRWKIGTEVFNEDLRGIQVVKTGNTFTCIPRVVESRSFDEKLNLYPIPYTETIIANISQNPGW
jgi:hypothetical protein